MGMVEALVSGRVDEELLLRNEYLAAENEILKSKIKKPLRFNDHELESLIITLAEDNPSWGYERIAGALSNLGYDVSDQTVGSVLKKNGIPPVTIAIASDECIFGEVCTFNKRGVLSKLILFGEESLRKVLLEYVIHYHKERNHQGKDNLLLFPNSKLNQGKIECRKRLNGVLKYYYRLAA